MRHFYLMILSLIVSGVFSCSFPETLTEKLISANGLYKKSDYSGAVLKYEEALKSGAVSASAYYNLGNAYYRTGKIGYAILNYERAAKLNPSDEDIQHNLAVARARITDKEDVLPQFFLFAWWAVLQSFFTLDGWAVTTFIFYLLLIISVMVLYLVKSLTVRRYFLYFSFFTGLMFFISGINLGARAYTGKTEKFAVIIKPSVSVRSAPDEKGTEAFIIHEGLKVKVEDELEGWFRIRLKDGNTGWLKEEAAAVI